MPTLGTLKVGTVFHLDGRFGSLLSGGPDVDAKVFIDNKKIEYWSAGTEVILGVPGALRSPPVIVRDDLIGTGQAALEALPATTRAKGKAKVAPAPVAQPTPVAHKVANRYTLLGKSLTSVLRWMGKHGWTVERAAEVLIANKIDCAESTLKSQIVAGANGHRGPPAKLSKAEIAQYNDFVSKRNAVAVETQNLAQELNSHLQTQTAQ